MSRAAEPPEPVDFIYALYFAPVPKADPDAELKQLLATEFKGQVVRGDATDALRVETKWLETAEFKPPTADALRYVGKDVPAGVAGDLARAERVFVLRFEATERLLSANRIACALIGKLATATGGYPWDEECRLLYTAESWHAARVTRWQGDIPDVRSEINLHAYRNPELVRVITLGLRKFGLADLVIDQIPSNSSRSAGNTVNACAQLLLEGAKPNGGRLALRLAAIKHDAVRAYQKERPGDGAKAEIVVRFRVAEREEGDPDNRLWKLEFPDASGLTVVERQLDAFSTLYGASDKISQPTDRDAIKRASEQARAAFFAQEEKFRKGFGPNERLMVKTGFKVSNGTEYMWVEVTGWRTDAIDGILANDSAMDSSLRDGKRVTVKFADIYDYLYYKADGTTEGNETSKYLDKG